MEDFHANSFLIRWQGTLVLAYSSSSISWNLHMLVHISFAANWITFASQTRTFEPIDLRRFCVPANLIKKLLFPASFMFSTARLPRMRRVTAKKLLKQIYFSIAYHLKRRSTTTVTIHLIVWRNWLEMALAAPASSVLQPRNLLTDTLHSTATGF